MTDMKKLCGYQAVDRYVKSGMTLGLGTGSTVHFSIQRIGEKLKSGELENIKGIPTSKATEKLAHDLNIPLIQLHEASAIDVAIDGADEVDSKLNLVKGRGGALLREKMVEEGAKRFVVVVDEGKMFPMGLGRGGPLPVEVNCYNWQYVATEIKKLKCLNNILSKVDLRKADDGTPFKTDNDNFILNLEFSSPLADPRAVQDGLAAVTGVVEHGLFIGLAHNVVVAHKDGKITEM
eukprot:Selendium_serpulae@DN3396_c0_g1_i1.p1